MFSLTGLMILAGWAIIGLALYREHKQKQVEWRIDQIRKRIA